MTEPTEIERAAKEVPEIKGEEDIPFHQTARGQEQRAQWIGNWIEPTT